jgi:microcystin degradation protein MlrC
MTRAFIATLATETSTFVPVPTGLADFEDALLIRHSILEEPPPDLFTRHGVDIASKRVLCVKALFRYHDLFRPLTADILLVATPGACSPDWS